MEARVGADRSSECGSCKCRHTEPGVPGETRGRPGGGAGWAPRLQGEWFASTGGRGEERLRTPLPDSSAPRAGPTSPHAQLPGRGGRSRAALRGRGAPGPRAEALLPGRAGPREGLGVGARAGVRAELGHRGAEKEPPGRAGGTVALRGLPCCVQMGLAWWERPWAGSLFGARLCLQQGACDHLCPPGGQPVGSQPGCRSLALTKAVSPQRWLLVASPFPAHTSSLFVALIVVK